MADTSKITTDLQVDPAKPLDANYQFDLHDRRYIDNQAIGSQRHLVQCVLDGKFGTYGFLNADSDDGVAGDCLCVGGATTLFKVTADTIALAGSVAGVVLEDAPAGTRVRYAACGYLPPEITGLAAGTVSPVRVNVTTGRLERVVSYSTDDHPVGVSNSFGGVTLITGTAPIAELSGLDFLGTDLATLSVSDANYTVSADEWTHRYMVIDGAPTTDHNLILTGDLAGERVIVNGTAHDWTIKYASGLIVVLTPGDYAVIYASGSNVVRVASPYVSGLATLTTADADYTVTDFDFQHRYLVTAGSPTSAHDLVLSGSMVGERVFANGTSQDWTVRYSSGLKVVVPSGGYAVCFCSGSNVVRVSSPFIDGTVLITVGDATHNLTDYEWQHRLISIAGSCTAPQDLVLDPSMAGERVIANFTGQTWTVKYSGGLTVEIPDSTLGMIEADGSNVVVVGLRLTAWEIVNLYVYGDTANRLVPGLDSIVFPKTTQSPFVGFEDQTGDNPTTSLDMLGQQASPDATGGNVVGGQMHHFSGPGKAGDGTDDGEFEAGCPNGSRFHTEGYGAGTTPTAKLLETDFTEWTSRSGDTQIREGIFEIDTSSNSADQIIATIPLQGLIHNNIILSISASNGAASPGANGGAASISQLLVWDGTNWLEQGTANGVISGDFGQTFSPKLVVSGSNVQVKVTPWSASTIKWRVAPLALNAS